MDQGAQILIVDDSAATLEVLERNLRRRGFEVVSADSVAGAVEVLASTPVDLVVTDLKMPGASGLELVRHVRANHPRTEAVMITGYPSVPGVVEAVKTGAEDYLPKPFTAQELLAMVEKALTARRVRLAGEDGGAAGSAFHGLVGDSAAMRRVVGWVRRVAAASLPLLVTGESGTGKGLLARVVHEAGPRAAGPFVAVGCGAIAAERLEGELFGRVGGERGGGGAPRAGLLEWADGGTLLLEEVERANQTVQSRLVRLARGGEAAPARSRRSRTVDVRLIASSSAELPALVRAGRFREDLFALLGAGSTALPPLRERGDDVVLLARELTRRLAAEYGVAEPRFSTGALAALRDYPWPGNVRELEDLVQGLVAGHVGGVVEVFHLPAHLRYSAARDVGLGLSLAEVETDHVRRVLARFGGNKSRAAKILRVDRKTLREMLKRAPSPPELR